MGLVVALLYIVLMVVVTARRPRTGLLAMIFFVPWNGFDADLGLRVSIYQLTVVAVLIVTFLRSLQPGWRPARVAAIRLLVALTLFAALWSMLQLAFLPTIDTHQTGFRLPAVRAPIQIALFVFALSPAVLIGLLMRTTEDLQAVLKTYLLSLVVLALIGWFQIAVWYGTGTNPLPIGVVNTWIGGAAAPRAGTFDFAALAIYRMNSFCGEPRQLGAALVAGLLLLQSVMIATRRVDWRRVGLLWGFLLVTTVATYSTSAVLLWLVGTTVQLLALPLFGIRLQRSIGQLATGLMAVILPLVLAVVVAEARGLPVTQLIAERTIDRIDENGAVEDFDLAILDWLEDRPANAVLGAGVGNAHLYALPYIEPEFRWYAENTTFSAKAGYLLMISELGFVGLLLLFVWYGVLLIDVTRQLHRTRVAALMVMVPIGAVALVEYMATRMLQNEFWVVAGALAVAVSALRAVRRPLPRAVPPPPPLAAVPA